MIITISGASCTGKSTLLEELKKRFIGKNVYFHGEFIRKFFDEDYSSLYKNFEDLLQGCPVDIIDIHKKTARHFQEVVWSSSPEDILVFDRSPIDISIYLYMNLSPHILNGELPLVDRYKSAVNYIYRVNQDFMKSNPIIFYTRPFQSIVEDDGFRPLSLVGRRELELALFDKEFLGTPGVTTLPDNLEDRVSVIEPLISKLI